MDLGVFVRGLVVGLAVAAPVGPIGVLCIRRTLADGRLAGLATGLGAATVDAFYGGIAAFGVTVVSSLLLRQQLWIRLIGGLFLCYLGLKTIGAAPAERAAATAGPTPLRAYISAVALTLANPPTILSFAAIFAGLGVGTTARASPATILLVLGVLVGSALWWVLLSSGVAAVRARVSPRALRWINRLSGAMLIGFGVLAFASLR
ncbi:MAG TPA: LysE family transporter [Chloroflexota bacterium]|nr:LysE family transporter [Chloroflexota bacterium]